MSSIKVTGGPVIAQTISVDAPAPVAPVGETAPATAADVVTSSGPAVNLQGVLETAPPASASTGIDSIKALLHDDNFGLRPNASPGIDLTHEVQFDPQLLSMDLTAWGDNELKAGGERGAQLKALLAGFPDALAPLDAALVAGLGR